MKVKRIPLRKCLGCNEMKPKKQLIRIVKNKVDEIKLDFTGKAAGRGAYICNDKQCFMNLKKSKGLNRAFQCNISQEIYDNIIEEIDKGEHKT